MPRDGEVLRQLVQLGDLPGDCWQWLGKVHPATGYGQKQYLGRTMLAHRWVYEQLLGPIPKGLVINHKCRNRACVNPHHLEVVSQAQNCRHGIGTKLKPEDVAIIKAAFPTRKWGEGARLARQFGVTTALIHDIWRGRAWIDL